MFNKNFRKEPTEKQKLGQIGEDYTCYYLEKNGYRVIDRNYLKKWGEIDIICKKANKLHFIEVKTVSRDLSKQSKTVRNNVIYETSDEYRAEDNIHPWKLKRLGRAVQSYLLDRDVSDDIEWQFDVVIVYIDMSKGQYKLELLEDIVL